MKYGDFIQAVESKTAFFVFKTKKALQKQGYKCVAEAYRSRTYLGHHCPTPVLKTGRHTGDETLPSLFFFDSGFFSRKAYKAQD